MSAWLGISSCVQLETVVSWQTAEFVERPVCQRRGSSVPVVLHQLWLLSCDGQTLLGLVEYVPCPGSCCAQQRERPVGVRTRTFFGFERQAM